METTFSGRCRFVDRTDPLIVYYSTSAEKELAQLCAFRDHCHSPRPKDQVFLANGARTRGAAFDLCGGTNVRRTKASER